jgi:hypothetical protein
LHYLLLDILHRVDIGRCIVEVVLSPRLPVCLVLVSHSGLQSLLKTGTFLVEIIDGLLLFVHGRIESTNQSFLESSQFLKLGLMCPLLFLMVGCLILIRSLDRLKIRLLIEILIGVRLPSVRVGVGCHLLPLCQVFLVIFLNVFVDHLGLVS